MTTTETAWDNGDDRSPDAPVDDDNERLVAAARALCMEAGHPETVDDRPMIVVDRTLYERLFILVFGAAGEVTP